MERPYITRDQLIALAVLIKAAVETGQDTINHGQVSVADARRALVMGLWRCRQWERQQERQPARKPRRTLPLRQRAAVKQH